jgi:hypothetical protein
MNDAEKPIDWEEELIEDDTCDALHRELRERCPLNSNYDSRPRAVRIIKRFVAGAMLLYGGC